MPCIPVTLCRCLRTSYSLGYRPTTEDYSNDISTAASNGYNANYSIGEPLKDGPAQWNCSTALLH